MSIYLDYNASAPIDPRVLDYMIDVYRNHIGNPDSRTHDFGESARNIVEQSRRQVASLLGVTANEVFFTSGATESCNIAIQGLETFAASSGKRHIVTTAIEHKAVLETVKAMRLRGCEYDLVMPARSGCVDANDVLSRVRDDTLLVSTMHVNNETGAIQPAEAIGKALADRATLFHVDATQSCGKLVDELKRLKYDMLSFSAHKFGGPQGIGVLILRRKHYKLPPVKAIQFGGQQEHKLRPGTVPVALVAGCGKACELVEAEYKENEQRNQSIKQQIMKMLMESGIPFQLNSDANRTISSTLNIRFCGVSSEALMISAKGFCAISNGSACTASDYSPSYVLTAMGLTAEEANESIRISWGAPEDLSEIKRAFAELLRIVRDMSIG